MSIIIATRKGYYFPKYATTRNDNGTITPMLNIFPDFIFIGFRSWTEGLITSIYGDYKAPIADTHGRVAGIVLRDDLVTLKVSMSPKKLGKGEGVGTSVIIDSINDNTESGFVIAEGAGYYDMATAYLALGLKPEEAIRRTLFVYGGPEQEILYRSKKELIDELKKKAGKNDTKDDAVSKMA